MRALTCFALGSALLLSNVCIAQDLPKRDAQAIQLLNQTHAVMGGAQRAAVVDIYVEGTITRPDAPDLAAGTFVAKARGRDFAVDVTLQGETTSYRVINGKGSVKTKYGVRPLRTYQTSGLSLDILPLFARWNEFPNSVSSVELAEATTLAGKQCQRVIVTTDAPPSDSFWKNEHDKQEVLVDEATGLVLAIRYIATQGPYVQDKVQIENRYSQYRLFGPFLLPSQITRYINGEPRALLQVQSVRFNGGLGDQEFQNRERR